MEAGSGQQLGDEMMGDEETLKLLLTPEYAQHLTETDREQLALFKSLPSTQWTEQHHLTFNSIWWRALSARRKEARGEP